MVERWHLTLKHHYLDGKRNLRADELICILHGAVDVRFRTCHLKLVKGIVAHRLTGYDKKRKDKAEAVDIELARGLIGIAHAGQGLISVLSFEPDPKMQYALGVRDECLVDCSCPDHDRHHIPCKHMYLVARVYPQFKVKHGTDQDINRVEDSVPEFDFGTPLEELISPELLRQLRESREEEERNIARKKEEDRVRENERREAVMLECENTLKNIWIDLGSLVLHDKSRKCSPSYFQSALASMHNAMRDIHGINEVKAGHRCQ